MSVNDLIVEVEREIIEIENNEGLNYEPKEGQEPYVNSVIIMYELRARLNILKYMKTKLLSIKQ